MEELMRIIKIFNEEREWDQFHSPENLAKSISIEAGELLECFQWNNNYFYSLLYLVLTPLALSTGYFFFVFSNFFSIISSGSTPSFIAI